MAMTPTDQSQKPLDKTLASVAAAASMLILMLGAAGIIWVLTGGKDVSDSMMIMYLGTLVLAGLMIVATVQLWRQRAWAQQVLLVYWAVSVGAVVVHILGLFLDAPEVRNAMVVGGAFIALALSAAVSVLLVMSASPSTRLRYSSVVIVTMVAALTTAVVVNIVAQDSDNYYRGDVATSERYGISDRTRKVLSLLDKSKQLRLTCVYTSEQSGKKADEYRPRTMEMLRDIEDTVRRAGGQVQVDNVTTVGQKAALDIRLRDKQFSGQADHVALLKDFVKQSKTLAESLKAQEQQWSSLPKGSYLDMWALGADIGGILKSRASKVDELVAKIRPELGGSGLPDCAALASDVKSVLVEVKDGLDRASDVVEAIRTIPSQVAKRRSAAAAAMESASGALAAMAKTVEAPRASTAPAADPAKTLTAFASAARDAAEKIRRASELLAGLAGEGRSQIVRSSSVFSYEKNVMTAIGQMVMQRDLVAGLSEDIAKPLEELAFQAENLVQNAKSEFQAKLIPDIRQGLVQYTDMLAMIRGKAHAAMDSLAKVDKASGSIFDRAVDGKLFAEVAKPVEELLTRIEALPEIKANSLTEDTSGENIVIIELGDEMKVATFSQVWPLQASQMGMGDDADEVKRKFNGDSAIGSKILAMSRKPFATVILAYYQQTVPPQMARQMPPTSAGPLPPKALNVLKEALTDARFEVKEWNLAAPGKPEINEGSTKILLVAPADPPNPMAMMGRAPQMPSFGPGEMARIQEEIDSGTPAIFLAMFLNEDGPYGITVRQYEHMGKYLREQWGVDVRHKYRLVKGLADRENPGKYKIDALAFGYLPVSTFTEHPIGLPLRGGRFFWVNACPVVAADTLPVGVDVQDVLRVEGRQSGIWATQQMQQLVAKAHNDPTGLIAPKADDMQGAMTLAVAATRAGDESAKRSGARIVVLGVGMSMIDGYLSQKVPTLDKSGGYSTSDPPRANTDVVINSAYWLSGHEQFIAAGPARLKPIAAISDGQMQALRIVCLGALPLILITIGAMVLYVRKH